MLSPEELPYMVDLHLFLSRPLKPSPAIPDGTQPDPAETMYGFFPEAMLAEDIERVARVVNESVELQAMLRSMENGYRLYLKTRPSASQGAMRRGKELPRAGPHPLLTSICQTLDLSSAQAEASLVQFTQRLKVASHLVYPTSGAFIHYNFRALLARIVFGGQVYVMMRNRIVRNVQPVELLRRMWPRWIQSCQHQHGISHTAVVIFAVITPNPLSGETHGGLLMDVGATPAEAPPCDLAGLPARCDGHGGHHRPGAAGPARPAGCQGKRHLEVGHHAGEAPRACGAH